MFYGLWGMSCSFLVRTETEYSTIHGSYPCTRNSTSSHPNTSKEPQVRPTERLSPGNRTSEADSHCQF